MLSAWQGHYCALDHLFGMEQSVELLAGQAAKAQACLAERQVLPVGELCSLGSRFIADRGAERRDEHEGAAEIFRHFLAVGADAVGAAQAERVHALGQQPRGLQEFVRQNGQEDVQLEIALRGRKADPGSVRHDLHGDHRQRLALRRVDLAGHDGRTGLVLRQEQFTETVAWAGAEPADIVCQLHQVACQRLQRAVGEDQLVAGGEGVELVQGAAEALARQTADLFGDALGKASRRSPAGTKWAWHPAGGCVRP